MVILAHALSAFCIRSYAFCVCCCAMLVGHVWWRTAADRLTLVMLVLGAPPAD